MWEAKERSAHLKQQGNFYGSVDLAREINPSTYALQQGLLLCLFVFHCSCTKHYWSLQKPEMTWSLCRMIWQMQKKRSRWGKTCQIQFSPQRQETVGCLTCLILFPQSLKKKVEFLQEALSTPTRTNEALGRLFFERCGAAPPQTCVLAKCLISLSVAFLARLH